MQTVLKPDTQGLTDWDRVNAMTEQDEKNALSDLDALPVEDEVIWEKVRWFYPESSSNKVENKSET